MKRHHLWDERWDVRNAVAEWLDRLCPGSVGRMVSKDAETMISHSRAPVVVVCEGSDLRPVLATPRRPPDAASLPEKAASQACATALRAAVSADFRPALASAPSHDDAALLLAQAASQACDAQVGEEERALAER